ncbi:unnamed protein product [Rotaria magnacalcarata]|uniref:Uncharacterized protein n=1 Tax=Rotaria magnacalcarata TaxID=392030 RepID=A0A816LSF4_9BILA|nr:unnamed protein product [Rotaria magnacalcarata]CAF4189188.1 unnamed protein product [Rotaria magnacalcarata]
MLVLIAKSSMARRRYNNDDDDELMERKFTARELIAALAYRQLRQRDQSSFPTDEFHSYFPSSFLDNSFTSEYLSSYVPSSDWSNIESSFQQDEPSLWHKYSSSIKRRPESSWFPDNLPESSDTSEYLSSYVPSSEWSSIESSFQQDEPSLWHEYSSSIKRRSDSSWFPNKRVHSAQNIRELQVSTHNL